MKSTPLDAGPPTLALARAVPTIPAPDALPGGAIYEPKWGRLPDRNFIH